MLPRVTASATYSNNAAFALSGAFLAVIAPANSGPIGVPTPLTQPSQATSVFGGGPLVTIAAKAIASKRLPVLAIRAAATAASGFSAVSRTNGHGTSVVTVDGASATSINAVVEVLIHTGGTIGVAGATYQVSTDGGANFGVITALGTANSILVALGAANLTLNLGAGTLVAGELISVTASVVAAGSYSTLDQSLFPGGSNTASASLDANTYPDNDYEVIVEFLQGGTLGTSGITYRTSTSNGRTDGDWSAPTALGTALAIVIPGTGGARVVLGTSGQTIGTGARLAWNCYAPNYNTGSVTAALNALFLNKSSWELVLFGGGVDASMAQAIDAIFAANFAETINGEKAWVAPFRMPTRGETHAAYRAAGQALSAAARQLYYGGIVFGDCKMTDAITGYLHKRPAAYLVGIELASVTPDIDIADVNRPALACLLADDLGNPDCYDDGLYNGIMDDYGFITLRTQPEGVYVTNPRIFSPAGTDVEMFPHRFVLNLHTRVAKNYFRHALSVKLRANKEGRILEVDAKRLERGANDAERDTLRGWISDQLISVSRTDNLLATKPARLSVSGQVQSLIYPKVIEYTTRLVAKIETTTGQ